MAIKTRPRVGFLTYDLQPFTEQCLARLAEAMPELEIYGYPVFHHPQQDRARIPHLASMTRGRSMGVDVPGSTPEGFASNVNLVAALRCAVESDVVVLFGLQGGSAVIAAAFSRLLRKHLISVNQTLPVLAERKRRWWIRMLKRFVLAQCDRHVFQTAVSRDVLSDVYGVAEETLSFAPFEAGAAGFKQVLDAERGSGERVRRELGGTGRPIALFVGNLVPFKGVPNLLEALARIDPDQRPICVFAGPEEPRIGGTIKRFVEQARRLGVEDFARFVGPVDSIRLAGLYWASDYVVLPTRKDCFPKVLVEGALASRPLVTTDACGASGSLVIDGFNGFVVPAGNDRELACALEKMADPLLRATMGARSRELVLEICDAERETAGFAEAISHCLGSTQGRSRVDGAEDPDGGALR